MAFASYAQQNANVFTSVQSEQEWGREYQRNMDMEYTRCLWGERRIWPADSNLLFDPSCRGREDELRRTFLEASKVAKFTSRHIQEIARAGYYGLFPPDVCGDPEWPGYAQGVFARVAAMLRGDPRKSTFRLHIACPSSNSYVTRRRTISEAPNTDASIYSDTKFPGYGTVIFWPSFFDKTNIMESTQSLKFDGLMRGQLAFHAGNTRSHIVLHEMMHTDYAMNDVGWQCSDHAYGLDNSTDLAKGTLQEGPPGMLALPCLPPSHSIYAVDLANLAQYVSEVTEALRRAPQSFGIQGEVWQLARQIGFALRPGPPDPTSGSAISWACHYPVHHCQPDYHATDNADTWALIASISWATENDKGFLAYRSDPVRAKRTLEWILDTLEGARFTMVPLPKPTQDYMRRQMMTLEELLEHLLTSWSYATISTPDVARRVATSPYEMRRECRLGR